MAKITNQRLIFVTGKGGVGKSTVAAALAIQFAQSGKRVLLAELGVASYFGILFGKKGQSDPQRTDLGFDWCSWQAESCLREYVQHLVKLERLTKIFFDNKIMRTFVGAAPALQELAILGKITSGIRGIGKPLEYDVIVIDAHSTGHFLSLLRAPLGMAELFASGPMGEQSRSIVDTYRDRQFSRYVHVTLPEELPVLESLELQGELINTVNQRPHIVCNMVLGLNHAEPYASRLEKWESSVATQNDKQFLMTLKLKFERQKNALELLQKGLSQSNANPSSSVTELPMIFGTNAISTIVDLSQAFKTTAKQLIAEVQ